MTLLRTSRAALLSAALLSVCLPSFARPAMPTLAWLLRKHDQAAASGSVKSKPETEKAVYALQAAGLAGTLTEYDSPPHKTRVEMVLGPVRQTTGDDGHTAWEQDMTGHIRILSGPELVADRAAQSFTLEGYDPVRDAKKGRITLRPQTDPGTGDYILDLAPVGGSRQTIYLNPHTFLVSKMLVSQGGISGAVQILSYTRVAGEQVPSQLLISYAGLPLTVSAHLTSAARGLPLSPALFAPPTTAAPDNTFLTPSGQGPATLTFGDKDGEIIVPVVVNGTTLHLLLDTGAGSSFLTQAAAKPLHLSLAGSVPAIGYGGVAHTGVATHATVELPGAVRLPNETLYVIRDPAVTQALTQRAGVDGALGYDLFARFVVTIDYATKMLTLTAPADYTPPAGADILPLRLDTHTPSVSASVDGRPPAQFLLDTGDNSTVHLYAPYARAHGLIPAANAPGSHIVTGVGVGGSVQETVTPNHTLRLGGQTLTGLPVAVIGGGGVTKLLHQAGGIGAGVLSHFLVTFDYSHNRLILQKQSNDHALGFLLSPQARAATSPLPLTTPLTTAEVLQKHLAALGGRAAVAAITSTRVDARVVTGGLHGTVVTVYEAPENEYEEDKIGILDITQGYDGKIGWQRDTNGNVRPLGPDEIQNLRNQLYFDTNSYVIPGIIPGKITLRPQRDPGTGAYVLDALPQGGKPTTIFLNPKSFLIEQEQHKDDNVTVTTSYTDYRPVNGVEFPFAQHTTNGDTRYDISLTVKNIQNNVPVPASLFQEPKEDESGGFVTPGATTATVPFDFDDGEIGLPVSLNGQPGRVFLDSGSSGIAIAKSTADALHLPQSGYLEARGYGGSTDLLPVKIQSFEIPGAVRLTNIAAVAIPLSPALSSFLTHPVMGFVGYDLLSRFVVRVDFPKHQITFTAPDVFQPTPADGVALPIALDDDIPTVTAQLDGLPPARYLVDTGDEADLRLYGPYVTKNGLDTKYPGGLTAFGGGVGGVSAARLTRVDSFTVAGVTLRGVPTDFSLDKQGGASQIEAGSIGAALLSRFVVTFDYPHGRIFLARDPDTLTPFVTRTTGLSVGMGGLPQRVVITAISPGAPAQFADVRVGDFLISVDGVAVAQKSLADIRKLLAGTGKQAGDTLVIQSGKNTPRTVTVPLFDPLTSKPTASHPLSDKGITP